MASPERETQPDAEKAPDVTEATDVREETIEDVTPPDLATQLAEAQARAEEYLDSWRRATAELSNARKRMLREQADMQSRAAERVLEKLLPIVDDVDRAFGLVTPEQEESDWIKGFRLIQRKLETLLESEGVTVIPTQGVSFDPEQHFAVTHEEFAGLSDGDIIGEVAKGFRLGSKVLRPSMVRVAK